MIAGLINIRIPWRDRAPLRRAVHKSDRRLRNRDAGAFRSDQCLGHIESVLRQEF